MEKNGIIEWDGRYTVGIQILDDQHRELLRLINNCYLGCLGDDNDAKTHFRLNAPGIINYIRYHFVEEERLLSRIKYPDIIAHKRQHDEFIRDLVDRLEEFEQEQNISPKFLVRYARDWLVTHIALIDKKYATYIHFINGRAAGRELHEGPPAFRLGPSIFAGPRKNVREIPPEVFFG